MGVFQQPLAAFLFLTAAIAENKRIPSDLPEAESELVAGYFTEYSAMKLGLFMFSEFIQIAIVAALFSTLFLGGYNLPFMTDAGFLLPGGREIALSQGVRVPCSCSRSWARWPCCACCRSRSGGRCRAFGMIRCLGYRGSCCCRCRWRISSRRCWCSGGVEVGHEYA